MPHRAITPDDVPNGNPQTTEVCMTHHQGRRILNSPENLDHAFSHGWVPSRADCERLWAGTMTVERIDVIDARASGSNLQQHVFKGVRHLPIKDKERMEEAWDEWKVPRTIRAQWVLDIKRAFTRALVEMDTSPVTTV